MKKFLLKIHKKLKLPDKCHDEPCFIFCVFPGLLIFLCSRTLIDESNLTKLKKVTKIFKSWKNHGLNQQCMISGRNNKNNASHMATNHLTAAWMLVLCGKRYSMIITVVGFSFIRANLYQIVVITFLELFKDQISFLRTNSCTELKI